MDNIIEPLFDDEVVVKVDPDNSCIASNDKVLEQAVFSPGSIHSEEFREFWKTSLKAGEWVMDTLQQGYVIPFEKTPEAYEECNNVSALKDLSFVYEAVADLKDLGIIKFVDYKPHCVSPLTVSIKTGKDGLNKKRLCWDGSRCVNLCIKEQKVTLSHLQRALELTRDQDYQMTYDLKAAYHHIKIHPLQTKFLGAAIPKQDGGTQYLIFLFLPFGLSSAVHCITKIFKPINAFLHGRGIRHSIFLDDGRMVAASKSEAEENGSIVYDVLQKSGFIIEAKKSDKVGDANQIKEYLGFTIDTCSMTVRLGEIKKQLILRRVKETIDYGSKPILARDLASTLGKIVATEPALGPVVIMAARAAYIDLDTAVQQRGWGTHLIISEESIAGIKFIAENFNKFDNSPIRSTATEISVVSIIGPPTSFMKQSFVANHVRTNEERIWASDASGFATCAYSIKGEHLYFRGMLSEVERELSSGHRELLAVEKTLEYYEQTDMSSHKATTIYWLTDSQNMATFLTKGSGRKQIQSTVFRTMLLCQTLNIRIIPIHLLRDDPRIQTADDGSKTTDTDDWQIDMETYQTIDNKYKFTIDLFASNRNNKCRRFFSNFYCPGTSGIDAFSHSWNDEVAWICPPIREVVRIIKRLKESKTSGILFVPEWKTADYWAEIFDREGRTLWPFKFVEFYRPFIIQSKIDRRSPFSGRAKFDFLAIKFDSH